MHVLARRPSPKPNPQILFVQKSRKERPIAPETAAPIPRLVGPAGWARLPEAVRARFGGTKSRAEYVGRGRFRATWFARLCAALGVAVGRPLPVRTGRARMIVEVTRKSDGEHWLRQCDFGSASERVRSVKRCGAGAWLEEAAGPIVMRLAVFEEARALIFECLQFRLRAFGLDLALPLCLTPGRIRVAHIDRGRGRFVFTLNADHPWFGRTISQIVFLEDVP